MNLKKGNRVSIPESNNYSNCFQTQISHIFCVTIIALTWMFLSSCATKRASYRTACYRKLHRYKRCVMRMPTLSSCSTADCIKRSQPHSLAMRSGVSSPGAAMTSCPRNELAWVTCSQRRAGKGGGQTVEKTAEVLDGNWGGGSQASVWYRAERERERGRRLLSAVELAVEFGSCKYT